MSGPGGPQPAQAQMSAPPPQVSELAPLDPNITEFLGPGGQPISREQFSQIREDYWRRTGRDPVAMQPSPNAQDNQGPIDTEGTPMEDGSAPADTGEGAGDPGPTEGQ